MWPVADGARGVSKMTRRSRGLSVVRWSEDGLNYCAVSDADPAELEHLEATLHPGASA